MDTSYSLPNLPDPLDVATEIAKAIGHRTRLLALERLAQRPCAVTELARMLGLSITTLSAQLQVLRAAGLVVATRTGTTVHYALVSDEVAQLVAALLATTVRVRVDARDALAARLPKGAVFAVSAAELNPGVVLVDVRPAEEFAFGHLDGAINIPLDELPARLAELPRNSPVVLYCRGRLCTLSHRAARILADEGLEVRVLETGQLERRGEAA